MIDIGKILTDWTAMKVAYTSGNIGASLHAAADLVDDAGDIADFFLPAVSTGGPPPAFSATDPKVADIQACIAEIQACAPPVMAASGPAPVGALGDGALLKIILDALIAGFLKWLS